MGSSKSKNTKELYQQKDVHYKSKTTTLIGNRVLGRGKNENNEIKQAADQTEKDKLTDEQKPEEETPDQDVQENISEKKKKNCFHRTQKFLRNWSKKNPKLCCLIVVVVVLVIATIGIVSYFSLNNGSKITKSNKNETSSENENETLQPEKEATWKILQNYVMKQPFTAEYTGNEIHCAGNKGWHSWELVWHCKCTDMQSGTSVTCENYSSHSRACEHSLAEVVRQMNKKNLCPLPSDAMSMPTGC